MAARSKARKRALDALYEADIRGTDAVAALKSVNDRLDSPLNPYAAEVVAGVTANRERIDELLSTYSVGWPLDRMPAVDRNILRIGTWEILWTDVPDEVAVSEAVTLASSLSTDESSGFVNGLLARILEVKPHLPQGGTFAS